LYFLAKNLMAFSENSFFDSNHKVWKSPRRVWTQNLCRLSSLNF
jgi:hypothetical protein